MTKQDYELNLWGYDTDNTSLITIASTTVDMDELNSILGTINIIPNEDNYVLMVNGREAGVISMASQLKLKNVVYNEETKAIDFTFDTEDGESVVSVDVSDLVDVYTAGSGLGVEKNQFFLKIDPSSEKYLSVSENGVKISGIDSAIKSINEVLYNFGQETAKAFGQINKVLTDSINTINGGIDNEIRPAIAENTENINSLREDLNQEIEARSNADTQLQTDIESETQERKQSDEDIKSELDKTVKYTDVSTEDNPNRKAIVLGNHDTILGTTTMGATNNLIMMSKWDKVDVGSASVLLNLNGSAEHPTYNDEKQIAFVEDIPSVDGFATKEEVALKANQSDVDFQVNTLNEKINAIKVPTKVSELENDANYQTSEEVNTKIQAIVGAAPEALDTLEEIANKLADNDDVVAVLTNQIAEKATIESLNTEIEARTAKDTELQNNIEAEAQERNTKDTEIETELNKKADKTEIPTELPNPQVLTLQLNGENVEAYKGDESKTANFIVNATTVPMSEEDSTSVYDKIDSLKEATQIDVPIRTIQDKVYTQEELLGWFGVADVVELKNRIMNEGQMYVEYGITLSTNPHNYKMPAQYVAFESANQIKLVVIGLNTSNDEPCKYEILMNLDGTIIEGNSNVKITMSPLSKEIDLSDYYTKEETDAKVNEAISGLATKEEVTNSVSNLASKEELSSAIANLSTKEEVSVKANQSDLEAEVARATAAENTKAEKSALDEEIARAKEAENNIDAKFGDIELIKNGDLSYELHVGDAIKGTINLPKDQFLKSVTYSDEDKSLNFVFETTEGEVLAKVVVSDLVDTYLAGNGLSLESNTFSVKIDTNTQKYIEVTADGVKIVNLDEALAKKVEWSDIATEENPGRKAIVLENHDVILGKTTDGAANNLIMMSKWNKVDVGTASNEINLNGSAARPTYNDSKEIALLEDIKEIPTELPNPETLTLKLNGEEVGTYKGDESKEVDFVVNAKTVPMSEEDATTVYDKIDALKEATQIDVPIRTIQDKVYTQEELLGWFGVSTVAELKNRILKEGQMYVEYGITLSTNPYNYKMPAQYVAFETANQIKLVVVGLDTSNDKPCKYEILMNLDGTIIEGNCNVKITTTPIATSEDIAETISGLATKQEVSDAVSGLVSTEDMNAAISGFATTEALESAVSSLASKQEVTDAIADLATKEEVDSKVSGLATTESVEAEVKRATAAEDAIKEEIVDLKAPYEVNLTSLLAASDSESISTAIGGIDNLRNVVAENRNIIGDINNGSVSVSIRILGNITSLYYILDTLAGYTVNEINIQNTDGTLSKNVVSHSMMTEEMVVDNLTSSEATLPLSANQGKVLDEKISDVYEVANMFTVLNDKITMLENKCNSLTQGEKEEVADYDGTAELNNSTKSYSIDSANITTSPTITAKSVTMNDSTLTNNARMNVKADTMDFNNLNVTGDFPKASGNAVISLNEAEYITFKDMVFSSENVYNGVEIGLSSTVLPKNILFENCKFEGTFSNNTILVFGTQDNATITLSNCEFGKISNALRLSNKSNAKNITVNVVNCSVEQWDTTAPWQGFLMCEDYTSKTEEEAATNNLYGDGKIKVNFINLYHQGKKVMASDASEVCATKDENQVVIICRDAIQGGDYTIPYSPDTYPVITFK